MSGPGALIDGDMEASGREFVRRYVTHRDDVTPDDMLATYWRSVALEVDPPFRIRLYRWPGLPGISFNSPLDINPGLVLRVLTARFGLAPTPEPCEATAAPEVLQDEEPDQ